MRRKNKTIHKRVWLEPRNADALSYVAYTRWNYDEGSINIDIADCNRKINLYFEDNAKGRRKLAKLIAFLQEAQELHNGEATDD